MKEPDRKELVDKLREIQKEFEGFPEEQTISQVIDELSSGSLLSMVFPEEAVRVTDILLMARTLGAYCHSRACDSCVFYNLDCPHRSWLHNIDTEMLKKHDGEIVTFFPGESVI